MSETTDTAETTTMSKTTARDPSYWVWIYQDLDADTTHVFTAEHIAMHQAERKVGNRSFAEFPDHPGTMMLYGPGDGTTSVLIRKMRRTDALNSGFDIPIE